MSEQAAHSFLKDNKTVFGFSQTQKYILFYFIFILTTCFGQLTAEKFRQDKNKIK